MEPEGSLPYSQVPDTCPYPEPTTSSPPTPSNFLEIHLSVILPSTSGSPQWPLSLRFPHQHPVRWHITNKTYRTATGTHYATFRKPINYSFKLNYINRIVLLIIWVNKKGMSEVKPLSHFMSLYRPGRGVKELNITQWHSTRTTQVQACPRIHWFSIRGSPRPGKKELEN
jgi:hypothetical protein